MEFTRLTGSPFLTPLDLLYGLWEYSIKNAKAEAAELQKIMDREGKGEKLEAWGPTVLPYRNFLTAPLF